MFDPEVVSFAHGEGIRRPHPAVIGAGLRALLDTAHSSLDNYLFLQRLDELDAAITQQFERLGVPRDIATNVVLDAGVSRIFAALLQIGTEPGDLLVTHPGFYHPLVQWCHSARVEFECVRGERGNDFKLSAASLADWTERHVSRGGKVPKVLAIFNPSMAGAVYSQQEMNGIAAVVDQWDAWVVEDCIFADTEFGPDGYGKLAACPAIQDRVVTLCGASKAYALANVRAGWACAIGDVARRLQAHIVGHAATLPQIMKFMALAALRAPRAYIDANTAEARERVRLVEQLLQTVNCELPNRGDGTPWIDVGMQPKAGHSLLLDFGPLLEILQRQHPSPTAADSIDLVRWMLDLTRVAFSPGASNGWAGGLVRCVHACVGAELTYGQSSNVEALVAGRALGSLASSAPSDVVLNILSSDCATSIVCEVDSSAGFEAGRARIRHAFLDRLLPAMRSLVNRPVVSRHSVALP